MSGAPTTQNRREAYAAWLALTAPGLLLTRAIVLSAWIMAPTLAGSVAVQINVRAAAAALLVMHLVSTGILARGVARGWATRIYCGSLAVDAALCGVLIGADVRLHGPAGPLAVAVVVMSLEAAGWRAALLSAVVTSIAATGAVLCGTGDAFSLPHAVSFPTTLSVETRFAGAGGLVPAVLSFPTRLSVETAFAGAPVATGATPFTSTLLSVETFFGGVPAIPSMPPLFSPTWALVAVALCLGIGANLLRARRARGKVAASILAAARSVQ